MTELFAARAVLINAHVLELPWKRLFCTKQLQMADWM